MLTKRGAAKSVLRGGKGGGLDPDQVKARKKRYEVLTVSQIRNIQ